METPMKKVLLSLAAGLLVFAATASSADAQRRGGFHRGGHFHGGHFHRGGHFHFHRGGHFHRHFHHRRVWVGGGWYPYRRWHPYRRFVGVYPYYGGCYRWRAVATPWGWQYRWVNTCYRPVYYVRPYYHYRPIFPRVRIVYY
jgi:hypothetical protein